MRKIFASVSDISPQPSDLNCTFFQSGVQTLCESGKAERYMVNCTLNGPLPLLIHIYRRALRERYAVGLVEGFDVYLCVETYAELYGYDGTKEFAVLAWV